MFVIASVCSVSLAVSVHYSVSVCCESCLPVCCPHVLGCVCPCPCYSVPCYPVNVCSVWYPVGCGCYNGFCYSWCYRYTVSNSVSVRCTNAVRPVVCYQPMPVRDCRVYVPTCKIPPKVSPPSPMQVRNVVGTRTYGGCVPKTKR
jgi:hypothetical protein